MLPFTVHSFISAPREEVFDFLVDLANRPAWTDHYQSEFRLDHPRSAGVGAAARYLIEAPRNRQWAETRIVVADHPRRIVEATRAGRLGRGEGEVVFDLSPHGRGLVQVDMTVWSEPASPREAFKERLGARPWLRRQSKLALERVRTHFEEHPEEPLARVGVAAWEPLKAPRFGTGPRGASG
jgi:uncharacterized protein YndB with AHSA1/START domain